jgi:hypothetical protein
LRLAHLEYVGQVGAGLFTDAKGDPLKQLIERVQRIQPEVAGIKDDAQNLAGKFLNWAKKNPEQAAEFADLAVTATSLNVKLFRDVPGWDLATLKARNPQLGKDAATGWQGYANLGSLQTRFMQLPIEARDMWLEQASYFKRTHNTQLAIVARGLLGGTGLSEAQIETLVTKTLAGTIDDDAKKLINDRPISDALSSMRGLRQIDGTYFPLMRFGDFVVQTRLKLGDLKGGTLVGDRTVEFRGKTEADARAAAKRFVQSTEIPVGNVRRAFYLKSNGEQVSAINATGQDVDVVFRVNLERDGLNFFDTAKAAEQFREERAADFDKISKTQEAAQTSSSSTLNNTQMAALLKSIRSRDDLEDGQKKTLEDAVFKAAIRLLPGNRIQKRRLDRRKVAGASREIGRMLIRYGEASGGFIAKAKYMPAIQDDMRRMLKVMGDNPFDQRRDTMQTIYNDLQDRIVNNVDNVQEPSAPVRNLMTLSFLDKLFSPAYSFVNSLQPGMTSYPWLAGRYGATKTALQMGAAYRAVGLGSISIDAAANTAEAVRAWSQAALDTRDVLGSIKKRLAKQPDGKELIAMIEELEARGAIDKTAGFEIREASLSGGTVERGLGIADRVARQLPIAVEQLNRSVVAVAAYRLAKANGADATAAAFETVMMTQFDYSASNSSTLFTKGGGLMRMALQFKKYAANMGVLLYDMTKRAIKDASPAERAVAQRQLAHLFAVQITMAGAMSLPGLELLKVAALVGSVFGGGGWDDWERWLRKHAEYVMGLKPAEVLLKGMPRALGIDLSSRLSLADMFLFGEPRNDTREGMMAYAAGLLVGAPGSLVFDWFEAGKLASSGVSNMIETGNLAGNGEFLKAFEKAFPVKVIADAAKAFRQYDDGRTNLAEAALQTFGIRPASVARSSDDISENKSKQAAAKALRTKLESQYLGASGPVERAKAVARIREYNARTKRGYDGPDRISWREAISIGSLDNRLKSRDQRRAGAPAN